MLKTAVTLFPTFISLFWLIQFILEKREQSGIKLIMCLFFGLTTLLYFSHALFFNYQYELYKWFDAVYTFATLAVYPVYFIYIIHLTKEPVLKSKYFLLLLPALIMGILTVISHWMINEKDNELIVRHVLYAHQDKYSFSGWANFLQLKQKIVAVIFFLQIIPVIFLGIRYIVDFDKKIREFYSNIENKTLVSTRNLYYVFTLISFFSVVANFIGRSSFDSTITLIFPSIIFGTLLFLVGFYSNRQHFTIGNLQTDSISDEEQSNNHNGLKNNVHNGIEKKLLELFEIEKIYTQPELNLNDISTRLNTNRTYISRIINQQFGLSFCDFTNKFRIEEACKILADPENSHLGMKEVSIRAGFAGESSFYRIFNKEKGMAPGEWRKKIQQAD